MKQLPKLNLERQRIPDRFTTRAHHSLEQAKLLVAVLWLVLTPAGAALAQERSSLERREKPALSYLFISPNTHEGLTLNDALINLASPEESAIISQIKDAGCRLGLRPVVFKSIGSWSDGAEHSTVSRTTTDTETLRYLSARLGNFARQKMVLTFHRDHSGSARLYVVRLNRRRSITAATRELDRDQIPNRTIVPLRSQLRIYIVDLTGVLLKKTQTAARHLGGSLTATQGTANLTGDENDRDRAQAIFQREMSSYESSHPPLRNCSGTKP